MRISEPNELVDEFKKSGEFDRIRRELLAQFQNDDISHPLLSEVEETVKRQLVSEQSLQYMSEAVTNRELMQEVERSAIVERAVADITTFDDPEFASYLKKEISDLLLENRHPGTSTRATTAGSTARYLDKTIHHQDTVTQQVDQSHKDVSRDTQIAQDHPPDPQSTSPTAPEIAITAQEGDEVPVHQNVDPSNSQTQTKDSVPSMTSPRQLSLPVPETSESQQESDEVPMETNG